MFVDRVHIRTIGGAGGNGCCSFRREKYVPRGGPDGGDGGHGGDIYIVAVSRLHSLVDLRFHFRWQGLRGVHGRGSGQHGKTGAETIIEVPCGTVVKDPESGALLCDLVTPGQRFLAARGGQGGRGNTRFANAENRVPRFAEKGEPGEDREYTLELKTIADVGIVGLPNAGKSTLLAAASAATPKIADYPFTTLSPNPGVAFLDIERTLLIADIPGIIEGAAQGKGLGHDFLRHIERTRVLLFLVDLGDPDPESTLSVLENELAEYSPVFADRPRIIAFNKIDITENRDGIDALRAKHPDAFFISAVSREGVSGLVEALWKAVAQARESEAMVIPADTEEAREYAYEAPFQVTPVPGGFRVDGERVIRAVRMSDLDNPDAVRYLQHSLRKMGLFSALKRLGAQRGDSIFIGDTELEYRPD